jgi:hypothetical protein
VEADSRVAVFGLGVRKKDRSKDRANEKKEGREVETRESLLCSVLSVASVGLRKGGGRCRQIRLKDRKVRQTKEIEKRERERERERER